MRHLRIMWVTLVAAFAVAALATTSAVAAGNKAYKVFANCPVANPELGGCTWAKSGAGSYFQAGKVTVQLVHSIVLQGGFFESENGEQHYVGPETGNKPIRPVPQPAPSLTEVLSPEALEEPERKRYEAYLAAGRSTKVTATVEIAGPASSIYLNEEHLLLKEGTFLSLPVQVKLSNPFLGTTCYVGSNGSPINIAFTDGTTSPPPPNSPITGQLGTITTSGEGRILKIRENEIVNNSYAAPGVIGCGRGGQLNSAINDALGLPSPAGSNTAIIRGELWQAGVEAVREEWF